jgi:hypothetical protein
MSGSRESSVWRTLAVAFGDGLAFGVGLTLTNNATRAATTKTQLPHPDLHSMADRLAQIEQRMDRARFAPTLPSATVNTAQISKVAEAVLSAMDGRFGELEAENERRLAEVEARIRTELDALEARARAGAQNALAGVDTRFEALRTELNSALEAQRVRSESDVRVLRSQMLQVHKEFAETLARLVDEQIEHTIALRLEAIREQMRDTVREESQSQIDSRLQAFRDEHGGTTRELAELRTRLDGHERNLLDMVRGFGQSFMQAADRISGPGEPQRTPLSNGGGSSSETHITRADDLDLPGFARQRPPKRPWRIPAVSGFLIATTGLLAIHYFVI